MNSDVGTGADTGDGSNDDSFIFLEQEAGAEVFNADGILISSMDGEGMMMDMTEDVAKDRGSPKAGERRMFWPER